jgi:hypothetical protein
MGGVGIMSEHQQCLDLQLLRHWQQHITLVTGVTVNLTTPRLVGLTPWTRDLPIVCAPDRVATVSSWVKLK